MKKFILSIFALSMMALSSNADICIPTDPDFDAADCVANGGTVGSASGIGGGPGGGGPASSVPIDGGLSAMLAIGGALGARRALNKKKKQDN